MEEARIRVLQQSWARADTRDGRLAEAFYDRLFELSPRLRDLFAVTDMSSQNEKFRLMMQELVRLARDPEELRAVLAESGRRHRGYGVVARDYLAVGEAFLWALEQNLPGGFGPDERDAWAEAYTLMSSVMRNS